jgi:hypothetical protein
MPTGTSLGVLAAGKWAVSCELAGWGWACLSRRGDRAGLGSMDWAGRWSGG